MSQVEQTLAEFVCALQAGQVSPPAQRIVRLMAMAVIGTGVAGAAEDGIAAMREMLLEAVGAAQATTLVYGDKLPAAATAQFNATMCRALDFCDAMAPGPHLGAAIFPAALAAAELTGACSGAEFFAALAAGAEIASRFNLSEAQYNGYDPTGVAVVFGAAAAAARVLRLTPDQTLHALALAFNRCAGSFQSNVDGSLAVRVIQGWVAHAGVQCAQMAKRGITGPVNFLTGHYGFSHLFGRGTLDPASVLAGLGEQWRLTRMVFKKYPSCGVTQGVTELALALVNESGLKGEDVQSAEIRLPPYAHRLVGHAFNPSANPRVDAQFSAAYCVANAFVRGSSRLQHFTPAEVANPQVRSLINRINVLADPGMDARGHTAVDLDVTTRDDKVYKRALDIAPGFPGADLTDAQQEARFRECMAYAPRPLSKDRVDQILVTLQDLPGLSDVRVLAGLLS